MPETLTNTVQTPAQRLKSAMERGCVMAPGAFSGLTARAVARHGFEAAYVSGAATSAAAGVPDVGLLTLDRFVATVREVVDGSRLEAGGPALPVIADADTGFGEEEMTRRTVIEYQRAGAAGLHLEDQVFPKRCGHLDGKTLLPVEQATSKIEWAARAARESGDPDFIVCARTDARGVSGMDDAIERATRYAQAGASMIFPEGLKDEGEFEAFAKAMSKVEVGGADRSPYMLANMTEFGKTPIIPRDRFAQMGYHFVIFPVSTLRVAMKAVDRLLAGLAEDGSVQASLDGMQTRAELYDLLGYTPGEPWAFR
ncbi:MAG: isocitrate lyase/phosphoenolpyruvate mutase family protein [Phycisphaerales bacterium]